MYTYMHVTTINEKRGHEFKIEQAAVYGREGLYRLKGRGKFCNYIIISKIKIILKRMTSTLV